VIEAVPENLDLKLSIMKSLDQIVSPDTILASNTSAIPIDLDVLNAVWVSLMRSSSGRSARPHR
jgi:3-hydroxyacyl-CoA dehydrogenase, NAD binding domain